MSGGGTRGVWSRRSVLAGAAGGALFARLGPSFAQNASAPVLNRPIPRGGEMLPVIGLGTSIVFEIGTDEAERAQRRGVIEALVQGGGKLIDTAASYGRAEGVVGDLVEQTGLRDKVFIATKAGVGSRNASVASLQESLRRLKTAKVDLMQLHNVRDPKTDLGLYREWKAQGLTRYIGITTSDVRDQDALAAIARREKPDFVQVNYSIADRAAEKRVLPVAKDNGCAVIINLPFGRNELFRQVRGKALPDWAKEFDAATWGQFFLKYLLANDAVNAVIPGTTKAEHMLDNLGAGRGKLPDAAMRQRMVSLIEAL